MKTKWLLKINDEEKEYIDFEKAKKAFKEFILKSIDDEDAYTLVYPFSLGAYFNGKYDSNIITEEEKLLDGRISMLLSTFYKQENNWIINLISKEYKEYNYQGEDEFETKVNIKIKSEKGNLAIYIEVNDGIDINYLVTNAFNISDLDKTYYFYAKEKISTTDNHDKLGKVLSTNITLSKKDD